MCQNNYDVVNIEIGFPTAYDLYRRGASIEFLYEDEDEECSMLVHHDKDTDISFIDLATSFSDRYGIDYIDDIKYLIDIKGEVT